MQPLKFEHLGSIVIALSALASLGYFLITSSIETRHVQDQLADMRANFDKRMDHVDEKLDSLPALAERVKDVERRLDRVEVVHR